MAKSSSSHPAYPVFLDLTNVHVLVVGGGKVATRKVRSLRASGPIITVVAPWISKSLLQLNDVQFKKRCFKASDVKGMQLVFAATDDMECNQNISVLARKHGCWVNSAAPSDVGNMIIPSLIRKGKLGIAISTSGVSAAVSKNLRKQLESELDPAWSVYLELLSDFRKQAKKMISDPTVRRKVLQDLGEEVWLDRIRIQGRSGTRQQMASVLRKAKRSES